MKNVLFVGDLRSAYNYGAIATTEALYSLIEKEDMGISIKSIDRRSFVKPTPPEGFPPYEFPRVQRKKKRRKWGIFCWCIGKLNERLFRKKGVKISEDIADFLPYRFDQFENYYKDMQDGHILEYERGLLEWADIVLINGEGNIVHGIDDKGRHRLNARYVVYMAWLSKFKYNLTTLVVNHVVDPLNDDIYEMISKVYPELDVVYVRDPLSEKQLERHGVFNSVFVPDALFSYVPDREWRPSDQIKQQIDLSKPYICIGDSSAIWNSYSSVKWDVYSTYYMLVSELKKIIPQIVFVDGFSGGHKEINRVVEDLKIGRVNLYNCPYQDLYHVLEGASVFVSGRWHASILSVLANTPILLWGADSHKTRSLYEILDYKYRFFDVATLPANIDLIVDEVKKILKNGEIIKDQLRIKSIECAEKSVENIKVLNRYMA